MYERDYAFTRRFSDKTIAQMSSRVREVLKTQGFGVLTEIDVQATLKDKLGVDRKPYLILGACNPSFAHKALEAELSIGMFLPCNVDIFEGDDGAVYVQTPRPTIMFKLVGNPSVEPIAIEVEEKLKLVIHNL